MKMFVQQLASTIQAYNNCVDSGNEEWKMKHSAAIDDAENSLPSGSGFDNGSIILKHDSTIDKIIFATSFHHMNDAGYYDGWTEHKVIVTPAFDGVNIKITGPNRNDIKELIHDAFHQVLTKEMK